MKQSRKMVLISEDEYAQLQASTQTEHRCPISPYKVNVIPKKVQKNASGEKNNKN